MGSLYDMNLEELDGMAEEVLSEESDSLADENDICIMQEGLKHKRYCCGLRTGTRIFSRERRGCYSWKYCSVRDSISTAGCFEELEKYHSMSRHNK